ncbi:hypothetical protein RvY_02795 [Ramazzottius varieornatus]|uniref:Uncharacterized protein n=1 Tax=Ramazzottius varieornatus TaxID=947166 RepID=A0A1D1URN5_RAMVA|nr:hypothetical protein RvY_02795 [Ramazzottius varieornatus]
MGKPKGRKGQSGGFREMKASSPSLANIATVEGFLEKIQNYVESCEFVLAEKFANRAVERFPTDVSILEAAAQCYTETGHIQKARAHYHKAIAASPLKGWRKYLGLAQLCEGKDALVQYTKGIEVMEREIAEKQNAEKLEKAADTEMTTEQVNSTLTNLGGGETSASSTFSTTVKNDPPSSRDLSNAYLAISELYTTDLCDEAEAEEACKYVIEKAMLSDPKNPEAFQQMANLHLIKGDKNAARQCLRGGLSLWYKDGYDRPLAATEPHHVEGSSSTSQQVDGEEGSNIPPLSFQIDTAKALIECDEFELAKRMFADFTGQNPTDPELWYLSGLAHFLHGQEWYPQARSDFKRAKKFSVTPHGVCYEIIAQCDEHLSTIAATLPVDESDSEDEQDMTTSAVKKEGNAVEVSQSAVPENGDDAGSDWETDEEQQDIDMS